MPEPVDHVPLKLSLELQMLLRHAAGRDLTLEEIEGQLEGRGVAMLILLLTIPFALPIPNPTSTLVGIPLMLLGCRLIMKRRSWLPKFILRKKIPHHLLEKIVEWGVNISRKIERVTKPRFYFMHTWPGMKALIGVGVITGAAIMALPFLVPNMIPAIAVLLLTVGLLEEDGLLIIAGYVLNILCLSFLALLIFGGKEAVDAMRMWFGFG